MSATLDGARSPALLDDAPIIECAHRQYPIATTYLGADVRSVRRRPRRPGHRRALREGDGNVLVFAPGVYEIGQVHAVAAAHHPDTGAVEILALHGSLRPAEQDRVLAPSPYAPRVIVATSIAETSLTIDGVGAVVDSGFRAYLRFDPRRGMGGLTTVRVSRASADQRRGRAGRTAPGRCYRLWSELEHERLARADRPRRSSTPTWRRSHSTSCGGATPDGRELALPRPPTARRPARGPTPASRTRHHRRRLSAHRTRTALRRAAVASRDSRIAWSGHASWATGRFACTIAALLSERRRDQRARSVDLGDQIEAGRRGRTIARRAETIARRARAIDATRDLASTPAPPAWCSRSRIPTVSRGGATAGRGALSPGERRGRCLAGPRSARGVGVDRRRRRRSAANRTRVSSPRPRSRDPTSTASSPSSMTTVDDARWDQQAHDVRGDTRSSTRRHRRVATTARRPGGVRSAVLDGIAGKAGAAAAARRRRTAAARVAFCRGRDRRRTLARPFRRRAARRARHLARPYLGDVRRRADLDRVDVARALQTLVPGVLLVATRHAGAAPSHRADGFDDRDRLRRRATRRSRAPPRGVRLERHTAEWRRSCAGRAASALARRAARSRSRPISAGSGGAVRTGAGRDARSVPKHDWPEDPHKALPRVASNVHGVRRRLPR